MPPAQADTGLAALSDQLILFTVLLYVVAMFAYAIELAGARARRTAQKAKTPALATVGGDTAPPEAPEEPAGPARASDRLALVGKAAVWLTVAGWAANLGSVVTLGLATGRWPWGNMYEFVLAVCLTAVTGFLVMLLRHRVRYLGVFVMVPVVLGLGIAVRYLYVQAGPVVPALNSYWIAIHVSAAIIASGVFMVGGVAGILYLIRGRQDEKGLLSRLPSREDLDRVVQRTIVFAFPVWTFAVIAGALWADRAWGRYWGWDPKETWSFITWIVYAAYLHARATGGWGGKRAMLIQLVGFACLLFNLFGVNLFISGLHSYAGF
ncbi:c-type cytochrome biogenesis protein CcsB [Rhizohabitans arisaemae]|uniref:c-type cytochrome biogenesis protein CcsB n=1 Tax=Rhizohabitans arisaemae TaxID=2720610 RepID=UPI0024B2125C|nr:c-type cytochrome biogenesis protein CcsB [Rhizohabitans arisaemae]